MDKTTTSEDGAVTAQPTTNEAVDDNLDGSEQVITVDESGTPTMVPLSQAPASASEAVSEEPKEEPEAEETQAEKLDDDIVEWTEKKGLKINPDNPNEVKLAQMQRDAERAMHKANQLKSNIQPPEMLEASDDANYNAVIERQNTLELKTYVRDWFEANPEMKEHRGELERIASERPYLQDLDDVRAHFLADPSKLQSLKKEGGRDALQNLAQKQSAIPPTQSATNTSAYATQQINPQNVYELVDKNDQAWFEKNHDAISRAMSGN